MIIRHAKKDDIPYLMGLLSQVLELHCKGRPDIFKSGRTKYTESELEAIILSENTPVFVAEKATRVIGYAFCIIRETKNDNILQDSKSLYIDDLCVDENIRGEGTGSALYEYVIEYARSIGCDSITLNVWECNKDARLFYEKKGLAPQKTVMEYTLK